MKIFVKTLKGSHFEIEVQPQDTVASVKKNIETVQGADVYPAAQQMIIHQGKVLKDETTLEESKVSEGSFIVIMLSKSKPSSSSVSTKSTAPAATSSAVQPPTTTAASTQPVAAAQAPAPSTIPSITPPESSPVSVPVPAPVPEPAATEGGVYDQAASNLVAGSTLEATVQQIIDMGGGSWDRDTVVRALRAAFNNPERAVEYLYSGIPEQPEIPPVAQVPAVGLTQAPGGGLGGTPAAPAPSEAAVPATGPNANPLDLFPQGLPNVGSNASAGTLDFLRNSQQQLAGAMPQAVTVTPEEREAIERLEAMGFERNLVLEVFFACNKDEELAANYLLDHMHEFDE
ncbi:hypothetical protein Leryth_015060 [Lithospermum erythrorhizon]|nr:hypothetical protein Leryth_015060 [Lithospermum erythrorhizon]